MMNSTKNKTEPKRAIYILCRDFHENSGSYAGMFEEFAKYASLQGYNVFILSPPKLAQSFHLYLKILILISHLNN